MPGDETKQKNHDESDSESEDEEVQEVFPSIDIDPSKLTPLSPEVISKQVGIHNNTSGSIGSRNRIGYYQPW